MKIGVHPLHGVDFFYLDPAVQVDEFNFRLSVRHRIEIGRSRFRNFFHYIRIHVGENEVDRNEDQSHREEQDHCDGLVRHRVPIDLDTLNFVALPWPLWIHTVVVVHLAR